MKKKMSDIIALIKIIGGTSRVFLWSGLIIPIVEMLLPLLLSAAQRELVGQISDHGTEKQLVVCISAVAIVMLAQKLMSSLFSLIKKRTHRSCRSGSAKNSTENAVSLNSTPLMIRSSMKSSRSRNV